MLKRRSALVSIHDVMPNTLTPVMAIIDRLEALHIHPVTLLVVPGLKWAEGDLQTLRALQQAGYELAGHGWTHRCSAVGTLRHRLHSLMMSRKEAEHLSLSSRQIQALLSRNFRWFHQVGLQPPRLYVPPAWGMGAISKAQLSDLPFQLYEYLDGLYYVEQQRFFRMPVLGYLADTVTRASLLQTVNRFNLILSKWCRLPIRIAIHPFDFQLGLAAELRAALERYAHFYRYTDIFQDFDETGSLAVELHVKSCQTK